MADLPAWALGVVALLVTFGPGGTAFFFVRWMNRRDRAEEQQRHAESERVKKEKEAADQKIDRVLSLVEKLEDQMRDLSLRLRDADNVANQVKGMLEKVEDRVDGQGADHKARLAQLEEKVARLDERTRNEPRPSRRK